MEWATLSKLSPHQDETAEGYLVCRDVPIARTGSQIYWENEVPPLQGDVGGRVHVDREAAEVFHPDSIKSFEGKPLVDDHPFDAVGPDNYADLAIGYVANVRRGKDVHDDLLLADLVFTTRRGIDAVKRGKRAISVGYNAFYEQTAPGLGRQKSIFCNHVALVDEGRCGARCTIMDGKAVYNYDGEDESNWELSTSGDDDWTADIDYPSAEDIDWHDDGWNESEHPRGQPENAGEFAKSAGAGKGSKGGGKGGEETHNKYASSLLSDPKEHSKAEARKIGDQIAEKLGIAEAVAEARAKVDALEGKQTTDDVSEGGHKKDGKFTAARARRHRRLLADLFTRDAIKRARPEPGQKPTVTVLGGRGGSGKSWLTKEGGPADTKNAIVVDADKFKQALPEYKGWNAGQLHEESDHLVNLAEKRAIKYGLNIVHDATLKSSKTINERVARYKEAGYEVEGHYMHLPPEQATERALRRFADGQRKHGKGRFVAPEIVLGNTDNEKNFDALIPQFKKWSVFDNRGDKPKFVAGSEDYGNKTKDHRKAPRRRWRGAGARVSVWTLGKRPARVERDARGSV